MNAFTAQKSKSHTTNELKTEIHKFPWWGKVDNSDNTLNPEHSEKFKMPVYKPLLFTMVSMGFGVLKHK